MIKDGRVHVIPENDGHPHILSMDCECAPEIAHFKNGGGAFVVHHAFDRREQLEKITGRGDGRGWSICYPIGEK